MKVIVLGDSHIPDRAEKIPEKISEFVESISPDLIIFTGDLTDASVLKYLKSISEVIAVRGNMDYIQLPVFAEVNIAGIKCGVIHGHQAYPRGDIAQLLEIAKERGVSILFNGHTHSPIVHFEAGVLLLNPGSVTGVWGGGKASMIPSFVYIEAERGEVRTKLYELREVGGKRRLIVTLHDNFTFY